ncbi:MAG: hypothetical protein LBC92_01740, partial [Rickettsiales bacterium]|nr:hypothetical protein [Rickettsiales bacterium]
MLGIEFLKKENDKNNDDKCRTNLDKSCSTTDTHGNLSVLMQEIILSGVATLDTHNEKGPYVFYDIKTGEECVFNEKDKTLSVGNKMKFPSDVIVYPRLKINENFKGSFTHIGDAIHGKNPYSSECFALLMDLTEQAEKAKVNFNYLFGNHEDFVIKHNIFVTGRMGDRHGFKTVCGRDRVGKAAAIRKRYYDAVNSRKIKVCYYDEK